LALNNNHSLILSPILLVEGVQFGPFFSFIDFSIYTYIILTFALRYFFSRSIYSWKIAHLALNNNHSLTLLLMLLVMGVRGPILRPERDICSKILFLSPCCSWKIAHLALNNNHSLTLLLILLVVGVRCPILRPWWDRPHVKHSLTIIDYFFQL
jgi:hypothetical protein